MWIAFFIGLFSLAQASPAHDRYQQAVFAYRTSNTTTAIQQFTAAAAAGDADIRMRSLYMVGALQAYHKDWNAARESFMTLEREFAHTSYADDAFYWQAKVEYLRCGKRRCSQSEKARIGNIFAAVVEAYPDGDMAPKAYYMASTTLHRDQLEAFLGDMIRALPEHSIMDDAALRGFSRMHVSAQRRLYLSLEENPPVLAEGTPSCRMHYIMGRLALKIKNDGGGEVHFRAARACSQRNDFYQDAYAWSIAHKAGADRADAALKIALEFKDTYVEGVADSSQYGQQSDAYTYIYMLATITHRVFPMGRSGESAPWTRACKPSNMVYPRTLVAACETYNGPSRTCRQVSLLFHGCEYMVDEVSAQALVGHLSAAQDPTILLDLMEAARNKGDMTGFHVFRREVIYDRLSASNRTRFDSLLAPAPRQESPSLQPKKKEMYR